VPVRAVLDVEASAGPEPTQDGAWRGVVSLALVGQGPPSIDELSAARPTTR
jgi:hypothetical protein